MPWVKKLSKNLFFLIEKHKVLVEPKKSTIVSLAALQQPLFAVPEHNTHPVG